MLKTIIIDVREIFNPVGKGVYNLYLTKHLLALPESENYDWILLTNKISEQPEITKVLKIPKSINYKIVHIKGESLLWHFNVQKYFKNFLRKEQDKFANLLTHSQKTKSPKTNPSNAQKQNSSQYYYLSMTSFITPFFLTKLISTTGKQQKFHTGIVVHDLITFLYPKNHPLKPVFFERFFLPKIIQSVSHIFTTSQNTKEDILQLFKTPKKNSRTTTKPLTSKIKVTYCGHEQIPINKNKQQATQKEHSYILSVASFLPRKNFETLIDAFAEIQKTLSVKPSKEAKNQQEDYIKKLYLVGRPLDKSYFKKLQNQVSKLNLTEKVIFKTDVDQKELKELYQNAELFVYPSLYEGFGLPLLEAMTQKLPIIASNSSSLPEVLGKAGLLFKSTDFKDLANKILKVTNSKRSQELKQQFIEQGSLQLEKFSWQKTASKTLKVIESAFQED